METWLLCLRGAPPFAAPSPEQDYSRPVLKKRFFGDPLPPVTTRVELALDEVQKADALTTLRQRRSFRHFEAQLAGWAEQIGRQAALQEIAACPGGPYTPPVRAAWIVPKKDRSTLFRRAAEQGYRDGAPQLVEIGPVPVPPLAPHALDLDADLLVYAERSRLHVVRGLGGGGLATQAVELPRGAEVHALVLIDGVVYAGGSSSGEVLGRVDLRGEARWERVEVPREVLRMGKGIDGFALHGGRLVAVDDMVLPRYLLLYDVADPRAPRFLEARDLKAHSSAESVIGVASNERAIALLSTSANHGFFGVHVSLLDLETLEERAVLHARREGSVRPGHGPMVDFSSMGLSDEALLIAAGAAGIGVIELGRWLSAGKEPQVIPFEAVRFVPVQGGRVIGVEPVDGGSAFAIVASEGGAFRRRTLDAVLVALR